MSTIFSELPIRRKSNAVRPKAAEQVILVHGTFATDSDDRGTAWWQVGSEAYQNLQEKLPPDVTLAGEGQVFRWSGDNNERARSKAAQELLDYLKPLEEAGKPYHLVGHSHGGSVIWLALKKATIKKNTLNHLKSWATVGTPFLRHRTRSPWNAISLVYMFLAASLMVPFYRVFSWMVNIPGAISRGELDNGIILKHTSEVGLAAAMLRAPIQRLMQLLGVPFTETEDGIRMGSFDPDNGQPFSEFLFMTSEGWIILAGILLFGYLALLLGSWCAKPVLASMRIRFEQRAEELAMRRFAKRWLGLYTPEDEAINGLRATLDLSVSFVGKMIPHERVYLSDTISLLSRPWFWLVAPIYNNLFRPSLDTMIRGMVVKTAQGNNRPSAEVVDVAPCPLIPPYGPNVPPVPESISKKILEVADQSSQSLGPKLRKLIAQPSFVSSMDSFGMDLSGKELVHTSYFDHNPILDFLAMNILWSRDASAIDVPPQTTTEMKAWFLAYKSHLADYAASGTSVATEKPDLGIEKQQLRRAA